ncbi:MAG: hypothetical protein ABI763_14295 [Bacteroidota bacterium]
MKTPPPLLFYSSFFALNYHKPSKPPPSLKTGLTTQGFLTRSQ